MQKPKVTDFISLYFITLFLSIPIGILTLVVTKNFHLEDLIKTKMEHFSLRILLSSVFLAPITEEIIFRSWLRFSKFNFILLISTLSFFTIFLLFKSQVTAPAITGVILAGLLICTQKFSRERIESFIYSRFSYFFYATTAIFGLLHTFNYAGNISILLLFSIILSGRQLIIGFVLGFIRMNYGLIYSILFHIMNNAIVFYLVMKK